MNRKGDQRLAAWIFGSLVLVILAVVLFFSDAEALRIQSLRLVCALAAGMFGYFLTGTISVRLSGSASGAKIEVIKATGGVGLFILVYWVFPMSDNKQSSPNQVNTQAGTNNVQYNFQIGGSNNTVNFKQTTLAAKRKPQLAFSVASDFDRKHPLKLTNDYIRILENETSKTISNQYLFLPIPTGNTSVTVRFTVQNAIGADAAEALTINALIQLQDDNAIKTQTPWQILGAEWGDGKVDGLDYQWGSTNAVPLGTNAILLGYRYGTPLLSGEGIELPPMELIPPPSVLQRKIDDKRAAPETYVAFRAHGIDGEYERIAFRLYMYQSKQYGSPYCGNVEVFLRSERSGTGIWQAIPLVDPAYTR